MNNLEKFGVMELRQDELVEVDGGFIFALIGFGFGLIIGLAIWSEQ